MTVGLAVLAHLLVHEVPLAIAFAVAWCVRCRKRHALTQHDEPRKTVTDEGQRLH